MECMNAPYNWSQTDDSNGAVPIEGTTEYVNGYDVMMAKKIADTLAKTSADFILSLIHISEPTRH